MRRAQRVELLGNVRLESIDIATYLAAQAQHETKGINDVAPSEHEKAHLGIDPLSTHHALHPFGFCSQPYSRKPGRVRR